MLDFSHGSVKNDSVSKRHAIIIGIEAYRDPELPAFEYAAADATALSEVWPADSVDLLLNDDATKTLIESRVRKFNKTRAEGDVLDFIFVGHTFAVEGENYLSCSDTLAEDLDLTSLPLKPLIDRGALDVLLIDGTRYPLAEHFEPASVAVPALMANAPGEVSYTAALLGQGIFAQHTIECLQKPDALSGADLVTHLQDQFPVTLRKLFSDEIHRVQTPVANEAFIAREVKPATEGVVNSARAAGLTHVVLCAEHAGRIKDLSGFNKQWHSMPEDMDDKSIALVENVGSKEVEAEAQRLFQSIRTAFNYKRRELSCDSGEGCATLRGPDFDVDINITVDPDDFSGYLIETVVGRFKTPAVVQSEPFSQVFGRVFKVLRFDFSKTFDIEDIIDTVEDLEDEAVQVTYPPDCSQCAITGRGLRGEILFDERGFRVQLERGSEPAELLETFVIAQELLGADKLLPQD